MQSEEALTDYIFTGIVKDLDTWQHCDDVYGFWLHLGLFEDDSKRPSIVSLVCLRTSVTESPDARSYGSKWAAPLGEEAFLGLCEDFWYSEYGSTPGDEHGNQLRNSFFQQKLSEGGRSGDELLWFLDVCGDAIQRIHDEGHLTRLYGKPFPIGVWISNDVEHDMTMPVTRDNNPGRISQGMEEWLMQRTYAQIAVEEELRAEVLSWPIEQQANFWYQVLHGQQLWYADLGTTSEWDQIRELGIYQVDWEVSTAALIADLIVTEAEASLSVALHAPPEARVTESLLRKLLSLGTKSELRTCVNEEMIIRLQVLLKRLYTESKRHEKISSALQLTAHILHEFRPERFPEALLSRDRENPSLLLEPERFGLE